MAVYVLDRTGKPLMPRARLLLARGRARVHRLALLVIRLVDRWQADCAAENVPLVARCSGGSDRVSNLTLACRPCNQRKTKRSIEALLKGKPELQARIKANALAPLRDAAAVSATRNALFAARLQTSGSAAQTKLNRWRPGIPKTHALDIVCVGEVEAVSDWQCPMLTLKATGCGDLTRQKRHFGFQTGDQVCAWVPAGVHHGRVAVRQTGSFNVQTPVGIVQGINHRHCTPIQRADGYAYAQTPALDSAQPQQEAARTGAR